MREMRSNTGGVQTLMPDGAKLSLATLRVLTGRKDAPVPTQRMCISLCIQPLTVRQVRKENLGDDRCEGSAQA